MENLYEAFIDATSKDYCMMYVDVENAYKRAKDMNEFYTILENYINLRMQQSVKG